MGVKTGDRDIVGYVVAAGVRYVQRAAGDDDVLELAETCGLGLSVDELLDELRWYSMAEVNSVAAAAARICGDNGIGLKAGEELFRRHLELGVDFFLRSAGSPARAFADVVTYTSKMAGDRKVTLAHAGLGEAVIEATGAGHLSGGYVCGVAAGYWARVPTLFGAEVVTVTEPSCMTRGDPVCRFNVRWDREVELDATAERKLADSLLVGFQELQRNATSLLGAQDVSTLLARIVRGAERTMVAPAFLLDLHVDGVWHVMSHGLDPAEHEAIADKVAEGTIGADGSIAVTVELASPQVAYGTLSALLPPGAAHSETDRRILAAYAGYASVTLDGMLGRTAARDTHAVTATLLDLARTLSNMNDPDDVCRHLAEVLPEVLGCATAAVWRREGETWVFTRRAVSGAAPGADVPSSLTVEDLASFMPRTVDDDYSVVDVDIDAAPEAFADHLRAAGIVELAVGPLLSRGRMIGFLAVGFRVAYPDPVELATLLRGVADLGATALENALLVERIRNQALQDVLTGLPNRLLLEDRAEQALSHAHRSGSSVGLLFIDLDRFKHINDTFGHRAGDELLRQVGERLRIQTRGSDTLARVGGDEFVLLAASVADRHSAELLAKKILISVSTPFEVEGRTLNISTSVGVAVYPHDGHDYDSLLRQADAAMYRAKAAGRGTFARP